MANNRLYTINQAGQHELDAVTDINGAAALLCLSPSTVRYHIVSGNLNARKLGGSYIISKSSITALKLRQNT